MPIPYRRCCFLNDRGQQCETHFEAVDLNKLCLIHREIITPNGHISSTSENKVRYIDLVNDERKYCYHFLDGTAQTQSQDLIFQFKDDDDGTVFEKLDAHIGFIEKIIEDMKARLHSARAVRSEKLDSLSEEDRSKLRKTRIDREVRAKKSELTPIEKAEKDFEKSSGKKLSFSEKQGISRQDLLMIDEDALLAKFMAAKKLKEENKGE